MPAPRALTALAAGALALVAAAAGATSAHAAAAPITGGSLTWTMVNVYDSGAPAGTDRTWMGYVTSLGPPFTNGSVSAEAPATGATVTPGSPRGRGAAHPFSYPVAAGGTFDADTQTGRVELAGTVRFHSPAHGFTITVSNPLVVLGADGAQVFASGAGSRGGGRQSQAGSAYGRSQPILDLDARAARRSVVAPGRVRLAGLAPAVATPDLVWPGGSYPRGAGPDRTPNTFGSFDLEIDTTPAPAPAVAQAPAAVAQPGAARRAARPRVRCRPTRTRKGRPRTTCDIRVDPVVRRVVVRLRTKRLAVARARAGLATVSLPRRRRTLTFVATDARGRELSRRVQRVGSRARPRR